VCFANCLPPRVGFSFVAAKISLLTVLLFFGAEVASRGQRNTIDYNTFEDLNII